MEMTILRRGTFASVQDGGRRGYRAAGVPLGGAADAFALRIANLLVGNPENAAVIEMVLDGPEIQFSADCSIAICGAGYADVPSWRPIAIAGGERVRLGPCRTGYYGYLAVRGGIDVPLVLGSRSTYVRGDWGGYAGRTLCEGDVLPIGTAAFPARTTASPAFFVSPSLLSAYGGKAALVRMIPGAQAAELDPLVGAEFKVSPQSDRMGVRLTGVPIARRGGTELRSSPVGPGTIQVPPDGQPIVLLAEAQTIGGYPQAGHVISVDLPTVAQLRPGAVLRFEEVALGQAHALLAHQEKDVALLRAGLRAFWG